MKVYNRTSTKLMSKCVKNPPEMWVRSNDAFQAVVDPELFAAAQRKINELTNRKSNQQMLDNLRTLLATKGRLTSKLIDDAEFLPCAGSYHHRFGSLLTAYELIGYSPPNMTAKNEAAWQEGRDKRRRVLSSIFADFRRLGLTVRFDWKRRAYIVDNKLTLAAYVLKYKTNRGAARWTIRQCRKTSTALVVGVRLDKTNGDVYTLLLHTAGLSDRLGKSDVNVEHLCSTNFQGVGELAMALRGATLAA
jgi:hypothetical protein